VDGHLVGEGEGLVEQYFTLAGVRGGRKGEGGKEEGD
jgi:hypothetical protein